MGKRTDLEINPDFKLERWNYEEKKKINIGFKNRIKKRVTEGQRDRVRCIVEWRKKERQRKRTTN